jgi:hypothetical protein
MPAAQTIDEVIAQLDAIIAACRARKSRLGYFPALYRKVTIRVKEGIARGNFEDGARMERLDVIFANRYLAAWDTHQRGATPSQAWLVAFNAAKSPFRIVLQHLLLGMNAHINLDLGIAAAQTAPGGALPSLQNDFNAINGVLASLVDEVRTELQYIWKPLKSLARLSFGLENYLINFSMETARSHAWGIAEKLAPLTDQAAIIHETDQSTTLLAEVIRNPPPLTRLNTLLIRLCEMKSVPAIIDTLI